MTSAVEATSPAEEAASPHATLGAARSLGPYALYSIGFLTLISTFNYLDRTILGLALPAIKREMQVSDTVLGLVSGLAFVLFYSLLGVPIAWLADRFSRRNIIAVGFAFWSLMTMLTGFVGDVFQLAAARFLMGAGEACGLAPSNAMISDIVPERRRSLALSIFGTANSIALTALFPLCGKIGDLYGWRWMFVAAGVPGIVLALLFYLTVKEPERGAADLGSRSDARANTPGPHAAGHPEPFAATASFLAGSRAYLYMLAGATFMGSNIFAAGAWTPTFLTRVHGLGMTEIASSIGPMRGVIGAVGMLCGGLLVDRLRRRDERWRVRLPAVACILAGPAEALFLLGDTRARWMAGFALTSLLTLLHMGPIFAAALSVSKLRMRAVATSIMVLSASLVGQAFGPLLVGFLNDQLTPSLGALAVRYSLLVIAGSAVAGGICFWAAGSHLERDMARAAQA